MQNVRCKKMLALTQAIDDFYCAFSEVKAPRHIDGCPCCIDNKRIPHLLSTPLRALSSEDLASYASSALLTVGDVSDYLFFLPRIMEISILDESWWPDIEVTARAIHSAQLHAWPSHRRNALVTLLNAVIQNVIEAKAYWQIDGWLCAIARMELDVRPYLAMIEKDSAAVLRYFEDNAEDLKYGKLHNAFWELPNAGHDIIVQWFKSDAISAIPFQAYGYIV